MQNTIEILKQFFVEEKLVPKSRAATLDENVSLLQAGIIDSLNLLKLIVFIEERFQIKVSDEDLTPENFETLNAMQKFIGEKTS
jgi:acyl carrier protein